MCSVHPFRVNKEVDLLGRGALRSAGLGSVGSQSETSYSEEKNKKDSGRPERKFFTSRGEVRDGINEVSRIEVTWMKYINERRTK